MYIYVRMAKVAVCNSVCLNKLACPPCCLANWAVLSETE